jgi:hypothetical protein
MPLGLVAKISRSKNAIDQDNCECDYEDCDRERDPDLVLERKASFLFTLRGIVRGSTIQRELFSLHAIVQNILLSFLCLHNILMNTCKRRKKTD